MTSAAMAVVGERTIAFYRRVLTLLDRSGIPPLVGGAYAFERYTGIARHTKDFDIFIRQSDYERAAEALRRAGYFTELVFPHWLGKAFEANGEDFVDLIFGAGNGVAEVDDLWFRYAVDDRVIGMDVKLIPAEEMIWSKGLIMERERFDGADVAHILLAYGDKLDWKRLIERFGRYWRPLLAHLVLFGFIYPSERGKIPRWVMKEMLRRLTAETEKENEEERVCFGTILSRQQYLIDIDDWGFIDARLRPFGKMSSEEIAHWTAGIAVDGAK